MSEPTPPGSYAAVILYYKLGPAIVDCIESLYAQKAAPVEVVLVDNASNDGVLEGLVSRWPSLRLLTLPTNSGYAAGMNTGVEALERSSDFVLLLTHEVVMHESCAEHLVTALEQSGASQAGPLLMRKSTGTLWSAGGQLTPLGKPRHDSAPPPDVRTVEWLDGACTMVGRQAFEKIGGFDPRYFLYWEDVDLSYRLAEYGGSVVAPLATAGQDTNTTPPYYEARNRILMWRIHRRPLRLVAGAASQVLRSVIQLASSANRQRGRARLAGVRSGLFARLTASPGNPARDGTLPMTSPIHVINPLPESLAHFEQELMSHLSSEADGDMTVSRHEAVSIEVAGGRIKRVRALVSLLLERNRLAARRKNQTFLILWPALGYLDVLTWLRLNRRNRVLLLVHDPTPLRQQLGYSTFSKKIFRFAIKRSGLEIICLTQTASDALHRETGIESQVVPHPVLVTPRVEETRSETPTVRVLGQFKNARNLDVLETIGLSYLADQVKLEIVGRGWPEIPGWQVDDRFVPEEEFELLASSAHCVLIPYTHFFQSGVAVRCLENRTPVVGPRHEQLETLFGQDWQALVDTGADWTECIMYALSSDSEDMDERLTTYAASSGRAWRTLVNAP